jgi:hypothetical protein
MRLQHFLLPELSEWEVPVQLRVILQLEAQELFLPL